MPIIYIEGHVSVDTYKKKCSPLHPSKVVFIFPGNSSHHGVGTTIFSIKSGAGLAAAAGQLGREGYPTLSLPTTSMEHWSTDGRQKQMVEQAIADLYRAAGAGFCLMLPVRKHMNTQYFDVGIDDSRELDSRGTLEPNFWGGIQLAANKPLANHYSQALALLIKFINLSNEEKLKQASAAPAILFHAAYLNGVQMQSSDPWLQPISSRLAPAATYTPRAATKASSTLPPTPATRSQQKNDSLDYAYALLNDYTKGNSACRRFFSGYWNRHHVVDVADIVDKIDRVNLVPIITESNTDFFTTNLLR